MKEAVVGAKLAQTLTTAAGAEGLRLAYSERKVRRIVRAVRREKDPRHVIGSLPEGRDGARRGYFVCRSLAEAKRVSAHLWSRVREQAETARDFDEAAARAFGLKQMSVKFEEVG